jgi:hypothetical protein
MAAFASPLSPGLPAGGDPAPRSLSQPARMAVALRVEAKPAVKAHLQPPVIRAFDAEDARLPDTGATPQSPDKAAADDETVAFASVAADPVDRPAAMAPAIRAPQPPLAMPAAELKAMMAGVVAARQGTGMGPRPAAADAPELATADADAQGPFGRQAASDDEPAGDQARPARRVEFQVAALVNGASAGRVPLRIVDGENISVRLGDLLATLEPKMDKAAYQALSTSHAAAEYVTFNTLRANGIAVRFDSQDRLILGTS